jgi:hypothetical protein
MRACELCKAATGNKLRLCQSCAVVISQLMSLRDWLEQLNRDRQLNAEQARMLVLFAKPEPEQAVGVAVGGGVSDIWRVGYGND